MEAQVLSQDEINALMQTVAPEGASPDTTRLGSGKSGSSDRNQNSSPFGPVMDAEDAASSDSKQGRMLFGQTTGMTDGEKSVMALVFDSFQHKSTSTLSAAFRSYINMKRGNLEKVSYEDFIFSLPEPCSIWYLRVLPLEQDIAVCFEPNLVHAIISVLMGGSAKVPAGRTSITDLEQSVLEIVIKIICREFRLACHPLMEITTEISSREVRPRLLQVYPANELMVCTSMTLRIEEVEGVMFMAVPETIVSELLHQHSPSRNQNSEQDDIRRIKEIMVTVPVSLEALVMGTMMSVTDLLTIKKGDVVKLEHRTDAPIEVTLNGKTRFSAMPVVSRDRKAIEIT